MTRKNRLIAIVLSLIILALVAGAGTAAYYFFLRGPIQHHRAEKAYAEGDWEMARILYQASLTGVLRPPEKDLERFAEACGHIETGRPSALHDMGAAYFQLALSKPDDWARQNRVIEFYTAHELWGDLAYAADFFLRNAPAERAPFLRHHIALANDHMNQFPKATALYQQGIDDETAPMEAYGNLAIMYADNRLEEQAKALIDLCRERNPNDPAMHVQRARLFHHLGDWDQAEREIGLAIAGDVTNSTVLTLAAKIALARGDMFAAGVYARKALDKRPESLDALTTLVFAYTGQGDVGQAVDVLEGLPPRELLDAPELLFTLADMQLHLGDTDAFRASAKRYMDAYPDRLFIQYYFTAREALEKGDNATALRYFGIATEVNPDFLVARFYQVLAHLQAGQRPLARWTLGMYLEDRPHDRRARTLWEREFAGAPSRVEAEAAAQSILATTQPTTRAYVPAAWGLVVAEDAGVLTDLDASLMSRLLNKAITGDSTAIEPYKMLACLQSVRENATEAEATLTLAREAGVDAASLRLPEAVIALSAGDKDTARRLMADDLASRQPDTANVRLWARYMASLGFMDAAMAWLDAAAEYTGGEGRAKLQYEKVVLAARFIGFQQALDLAAAVEPAIAHYPNVLVRLESERRAIQALMRGETGE